MASIERIPVRFAGHGGDQVEAVCVQPIDPAPDRRASGARAAVLVIHEVFGIEAHVLDVAELLARPPGRPARIVLAPNLYSREGLPAPEWTVEAIRAAVRGLPDRRVLADLEAALAYLAARDDVDAQRIAVVGFCMGGTYAFLLACASSIPAAVVDVYGRIVHAELDEHTPIQPLEMALNLGAPLLALFGAEDASIPPEHVERMRDVLTQFARDFEIVAFPGAGHGFLNEHRAGHDPVAAGEAWRRIEAFLDEHL